MWKSLPVALMHAFLICREVALDCDVQLADRAIFLAQVHLSRNLPSSPSADNIKSIGPADVESSGEVG